MLKWPCFKNDQKNSFHDKIRNSSEVFIDVGDGSWKYNVCVGDKFEMLMTDLTLK